ncbi:hypothetical protein FDP41_012676 [Naegleria fowleri]|uniref:RRM domain-containing protein n=1 Tax=Naegleria fowleri TaxID=5763 RepID=A0A6A5C4V0_NAEFO|nr:uncharacterized protein FDP41_012676 [Naegleria fowleri]KAF0980888.1 hypothetical protein FDP41_012676 [Naegleria fowleri]CAG4717213.1 unnamed protein product [Naegleria fowleri]
MPASTTTPSLKDKLRELKQKQQTLQIKEQEYKDQKEQEEIKKDVMMAFDDSSDDDEEEEEDLETNIVATTTTDATSNDHDESTTTDKVPHFQAKKEEAVNRIAAIFENLKQSRLSSSSDSNKQSSSNSNDIVDFSNTNRTFVIKRLPHGFYEEEITKFFSQVGTVLNVRIPRSKKTGQPLFKAYVQMEDPEIAQMIVETFDYYLLNDRVIRVSMLDGDNPVARQKQIFKFKKEDHTSALLANGEAAKLKKQQKLFSGFARSDASKIVKKSKKNKKDYLRKIRNKLQKKINESVSSK